MTNTANISTERYNSEEDYYLVKKYLELKEQVGKIFANPERTKAAREHIIARCKDNN